MSHPPSTGPRIGPIITPPPNSAIAWPCFSRGLMSNRVAWASGTMNAPPTPWSARNTTISVSDVAVAHSTDATVNTTTEIRSSRLRPTLSASQPLIGKAIAEATM